MDQKPTEEALLGREILMFYENDKRWYLAVVAKYYRDRDEYQIVYRSDGSIENTKLADKTWAIVNQKKSNGDTRVLIGAVVEFIWKYDGEKYEAMVYNSNDNGSKISVVYMNYDETDVVEGQPWSLLKDSPSQLKDAGEQETRDTSASLPCLSRVRLIERSE